MNQTATETIAPVNQSGPGLATRSPVLQQFRTNPFRVLRVSPSIAVDQAIWKAEEALTLLRAGLPRSEPDLLPWLPEPDEPETRQAVQRIEEPLRRLTDELFWFDLDRDADGDLLRRALVELEPAVLNEYLGRCVHDGLPHRPIVKLAVDGVFQVSTNGVAATDSAWESDEPAPPDKTPVVETAGVPRLLNHARLRLLLAALSLYDALPDGVSVPDADDADPADAVTSRFEWVQWRGLDIAENPHELDLTGGRHVLRTRRTVALWSDCAGTLDPAHERAGVPRVRAREHRAARRRRGWRG